MARGKARRKRNLEEAKRLGLPVSEKTRKPFKTHSRIAAEMARLQGNLSYKHCLALFKNPKLAEVVAVKQRIPLKAINHIAATRVFYGRVVNAVRRELLRKELVDKIPGDAQVEFAKAIDKLAQAGKDNANLKSQEIGEANRKAKAIVKRFLKEREPELEPKIWFLQMGVYVTPIIGTKKRK